MQANGVVEEFLYNYSINCWGHKDPEAQKCMTIRRLSKVQ